MGRPDLPERDPPVQQARERDSNKRTIDVLHKPDKLISYRQREEFVTSTGPAVPCEWRGRNVDTAPSRRSFRRWRSRLQTGRRRGGTRSPQQAQRPPNRRTWVTSGRPGATRCAHRPAAGFVTRPETPLGISGRWSAAGRSCDPGADAASDRHRGGFGAAGDLHQVPGGLACVLARAASMNCRGSSAGGFGGGPRLQGRDAFVLRGDALVRQHQPAVSAAISASFSAWLRWAGAGSRSTHRVDFDSGVTVSRTFSRRWPKQAYGRQTTRWQQLRSFDDPRGISYRELSRPRTSLV